MSDPTPLITQAQGLLVQAQQLLAQALPPQVPGMPSGVVQVGPGTIVSVQPEQGPFGPTGADTITMVTDAGQTVSYHFYKPSGSLVLGARVTLSVLPATTPGNYDVLYGVTSAASPQPLSGA